jgi:hypothetical protein
MPRKQPLSRSPEAATLPTCQCSICDGRGLLRVAVLTGGGGEGCELPCAVLLSEIEEITAAVNELAIYEEVKGRRDDGQVVVDADVRIVDAFLVYVAPEVATRSAKLSMQASESVALRSPLSRHSCRPRAPIANMSQDNFLSASSSSSRKSLMSCNGGINSAT